MKSVIGLQVVSEAGFKLQELSSRNYILIFRLKTKSANFLSFN